MTHHGVRTLKSYQGERQSPCLHPTFLPAPAAAGAAHTPLPSPLPIEQLGGERRACHPSLVRAATSLMLRTCFLLFAHPWCPGPFALDAPNSSRTGPIFFLFLHSLTHIKKKGRTRRGDQARKGPLWQEQPCGDLVVCSKVQEPGNDLSPVDLQAVRSAHKGKAHSRALDLGCSSAKTRQITLDSSPQLRPLLEPTTPALPALQG